MLSLLSVLRLSIASAALVFLCRLAYLKLFQRRRPYPLPPGPKGEPILGHLRVIPGVHPEYQYTQWGKEYGSDILYFNVLGRHIVVLNSVEAAHDLLDKRGANYADRPRFALFLRFGPRFKLHRKLLQSSFTPSACKQYRPIQEQEARRAVKAILGRPQDWEVLLRQYSTAVVLRIGFGITVKERDDPYVKMAIDVEEATGEGGVPAASFVDFFPAFRHVPNWIARLTSTFRPLEHARRTKPFIQQLHDAPWAATEPSIRAGTATDPSFMRTHLERLIENEEAGKSNEATIADIKGAAGAISIAGGNTTWSTIIICILNLLLHPSIQRKVQAEIDAVCGGTRLPTFDDRDKMPYLEYVIQETTRFIPLSPLGVPHATVQDDIYKGFFIPKGSVVFANAHAMTHDPRHYSEPDSFDPDRYIPVSLGGKGEPLPEGSFGFGRRVCPGQYLALAGVYIAIATLLATVDLRYPVDADGNASSPEVKLSNGLSSVPESFGCVMVPRSEGAKQLLSTSTVE